MTGNQPKLTAKIKMSSTPITKSGTDNNPNAKVVEARSNMPPARCAAISANGSAMNSARISE